MDEYVKRLQQKAGQGMQAIGGAAKNAAEKIILELKQKEILRTILRYYTIY